VITIIDQAALLAKFGPYQKLWDLKPKIRCRKCKGALMIRRGERPAQTAGPPATGQAWLGDEGAMWKSAITASAMLVFCGNAVAEPSPHVRWLMNHDVSLFSFGLYRMELAIQDAKGGAGFEFITFIQYEWDRNQILIQSYATTADQRGTIVAQSSPRYAVSQECCPKLENPSPEMCRFLLRCSHLTDTHSTTHRRI